MKGREDVEHVSVWGGIQNGTQRRMIRAERRLATRSHAYDLERNREKEGGGEREREREGVHVWLSSLA